MSMAQDDRGFLLGDGLFETMMALNGNILHLGAHYDRLSCSAKDLGLTPPTLTHMQATCAQAIDEADLTNTQAIVRFTLTSGSGGRGLIRPDPLMCKSFAAAFIMPTPPKSLKLGLSPIRRNETSPTSQHKTLSYIDNVMARKYALAEGFDDAVMLNTKGEIACATAANIFWFEDDSLMTPALDCGILAGITRALILNAASQLGLKTQQLHKTYAQDLKLQGVFLSNSAIGMVTVSNILNLDIQPSPYFERLRQALNCDFTS